MVAYIALTYNTHVLQSVKIEWSQPDCPGWDQSYYKTGKVFVVQFHYLSGENLPDSKSYARESDKVINIAEVKVLIEDEARVHDGTNAAADAHDEVVELSWWGWPVVFERVQLLSKKLVFLL